MQKVLITGANGFVGQSLVRLLLTKGYSVIALGKGPSRLSVTHPSLQYFSVDITHPFEAQQVISHEQPDCIVHCAAMTQVDDCELLEKEAHSMNVEATARLLLDAESHSRFFILLSTDFVFDGLQGMYTEEDSVNPVSWYGHTKMEAEAITETAEIPWAIIRTCLVYGEKVENGRNNLFTWLRENLEAQKPVKVVDDQWRTPTWVEDLAIGIELVIAKKAAGLWHISGEDQYTPYQMAVVAADHFGWDKSLIERVTADTFTQAGKRPARTGFNINKAKKELGFSPGSFLQNLQHLQG
ncbi:SDR family oxidoreductase [Flavihumibacter fluvii]|uniref:SDR family oxidoreductase n=1 Tax=Flavihumibacter fluvii TaxID=2838157 RepID=UPI001BDF2D40|nr:SDR family oxidoreductase [Flavihumibacter fluvii]ULQ53771.1 SDR family oxidoreductase [Flavihumibacter fluvii]